MKRQTRLTPAEGGRFAGPVGSPVPPNDADRGQPSRAFIAEANAIFDRTNKLLAEHGCELATNDGRFQWLVIKGDRVLMRLSRAQRSLSGMAEDAALIAEVLRREAATRDDLLEMLDDARNSERMVQTELNRARREVEVAADDIARLVKEKEDLAREARMWRDQSSALQRKQGDSLVESREPQQSKVAFGPGISRVWLITCEAHDYDLDTGACRDCGSRLELGDWNVMREVTGRPPKT